jgi:tRNA threonylcarbamoyladenosine biosynthesis protein TsaB
MDEVYWGCYRETGGEMRLVGVEAVQPPEAAALPADASGDWFGAGTGWGYGERIAVPTVGQDAAMLPHAEDLLTLARFAWERGEAVPADQAAPVYLRDKVAQTKAERQQS